MKCLHLLRNARPSMLIFWKNFILPFKVTTVSVKGEEAILYTEWRIRSEKKEMAS